MGDLKRLYQARASGLPQYLMRGDGALMGWVAILNISERSTYLDLAGVGQIIDVDITVRRCSGPAAGALMAAYLGERLGEPNLLSFDMGGTTGQGRPDPRRPPLAALRI